MHASPSRRRGFCLLAALTVGLSVLSAASLARAAGLASVAFPGKNGLIAFNSDGSVYVVRPEREPGCAWSRRPGSRTDIRVSRSRRMGS